MESFLLKKKDAHRKTPSQYKTKVNTFFTPTLLMLSILTINVNLRENRRLQSSTSASKVALSFKKENGQHFLGVHDRWFIGNCYFMREWRIAAAEGLLTRKICLDGLIDYWEITKMSLLKLKIENTNSIFQNTLEDILGLRRIFVARTTMKSIIQIKIFLISLVSYCPPQMRMLHPS